MGEAGVHRRIEMSAWNVNEVKLLDSANLNLLTNNLPQDQQLAYQVYAGNWMRDFSQVFVPFIMENAKQIKKEGGVAGQPIGAKGAEALLDALLKAFAILELGDGVGTTLITPQNLGAYRAEEHMDNPGGYRLKNDLLIKVNDEFVTADTVSEDVRLREIGGSAFKNNKQIEEEVLYTLGPNMLSLHIFNTTEWVKNSFIDALSEKDDVNRRMKFGRGLHGVEDYFAHSNYIEVILNLLATEPKKYGLPDSSGLRKKPSTPNPINSSFPVDSLFEIPPVSPTKPSSGSGGQATVLSGSLKRQAITTGTFGGLDTKISIIHVLIPLVDPLFKAINNSIDEWLTIVEQEDESTVEKIIAKSRLVRSSMALDTVLKGIDAAGITFPILFIETKKIRELIDSDFVKKFIPDSILDVQVPVSKPGLKQVSTKEAFNQYLQIFRVAKVIIKFRKSIEDVLKGDLGKGIVRAALTEALDLIDTGLKKFKDFLKFQVRKVMIRLIATMLGLDLSKIANDKEEALNKLADNVQEFIARMVEEADFLVPSTSLQTRINTDLAAEKGNPKVVPKGDVKELPPSHSEICKDHPNPHESIFFELHRELAIEAVRHLTLLMHKCWSSAGLGTKVIAGQVPQPSANSLEDLNKEADNVSKTFKGNLSAINSKAPITFAQDKVGTGAASEDLKKLLNAVDMYISHSIDTSWWIPVVKQYIASGKESKVLAEINERNKTRTRRK
jgi:hypothetical protein